MPPIACSSRSQGGGLSTWMSIFFFLYLWSKRWWWLLPVALQQQPHGAGGGGASAFCQMAAPPMVKAWDLVQHVVNLNRSPRALVPSACDVSLYKDEYAASCGGETSHWAGHGDANRKCRVVYSNTCVRLSVTASLQKKKVWQILLILFFLGQLLNRLGKMCTLFSLTSHAADSLQLHISNNLIFICSVSATKITPHQPTTSKMVLW